MIRLLDVGNGAVGLLLDITGEEPPTEFRILANGTTETTKGPVVFDNEAGELVMKAFAEHGLDQLPFDVGHGMLNPFSPPSGHKAFGWFKPEVRKDGLWASDIEWLEAGARALRKREFRFFSPAIMLDHDSGRVTQLINIALTNIPATKGQKPLVAHAAGDPPASPARGHTMEETLKLLGVTSDAAGVTRVTELLRLSTEIRELTGARDDAAALHALRTGKEEALKLAQQIASLEAAQLAAKREGVIARLSQEGKLPPALHAWATTQTIESLELFAQSAPVVAVSQAGAAPAPAEGVVTLSAEERAVAAQLGLDPQALIDEKRRLSAVA